MGFWNPMPGTRDEDQICPPSATNMHGDRTTREEGEDGTVLKFLYFTKSKLALF